MSIYQLKPRFQALLRPLVARLAARGVTANQVTLAACAVSLLLGLGLYALRAPPVLFILVALWMLLRMALNAVDGMLAREHGQKSTLGAYLNELTDVVSDAALYLPFAAIAPFSPFWVGVVIVLAGLSEFAGALGPSVGASRRYDGPMGKSDRAFVFGLLALWIALGLPLPPWLAWLMPLLALLLAWTVANRVRRGVAEVRAAAAVQAVAAGPLTQRPLSEHSFASHDGVALFYRHWPAMGAQRRGAVLLFHRGHEHGGRMAHLVDELDLPDFDFFAWDARGHGRSPGERGHSPSLAHTVGDVQAFVEHIAAEHGVPEQDLYVVAQSVGAVQIATWLHDYAPRVRGATLASPAFKVKLYVPLARPGLALLYRLRGLFFVNSYVKARYLTHDKARIASFNADPLISRAIAVNILLDLYATAERVVQDANAIIAPTQLLVSGADWVVHRKPQQQFFQRLGSSVKEQQEFAGFYHDTLGERDRAAAVAAVRAFALRCFDAPAQPVDLLQADLSGATAEEARALAQPLPPWSPAGLYWRATRAGLRVGGLLSQGIRLGQQTGFDSGSTLDYVYRNQPAGRLGLGRWMDARYLDSMGWHGIRVRKQHVEELLQIAMQDLARAGTPLRLLDIAAGHGRYVLDAVAASAVPVDSILLRDYSEINVRDGRQLIAERGLQDKARFVQADAFDRASLAAVSPRATLAIVSGLYELFPDNAPVRTSLAGVADALELDGYLVYTGQPWHPQLEFIARALTSHRQGQAWVMRRRTQAELDQLVAAAGFRKLTERIDPWGIFTVSLARRVIH